MTPAGKRGSTNLAALGSAAVLAVYAAGYARTDAAARRFEGSDAVRRPVTPAPPVHIDSAALIEAVRQESLRVAPVTVPSRQAVAGSPVGKAAAPRQTGQDRKSSPAIAAPASGETPAPTTATPPASLTTATPPASPPPAAPTAPPDTAKPAADTTRALKDGVFTGWGSSRHGDIEAAVEIQNGRIVKAYITQCLTRYSCGRIASIVPQVVERQSAEVDYVSGATQSTNAFYYAIVEALSKAK